MSVEIRTPDGKLFTPRQVGLDDLARFRDLRGTAQGLWTYSVRGQSEPIEVVEGETRVRAGRGSFGLVLEEFVPSQSAPPLVDARLGARALRRFRFDLFRVGDFVARARSTLAGLVSVPESRRMRLLDPDGQVMAVGEGGRLTFPVSLRTLARSRDIAGNPRLWTLEVFPATGPFAATSQIWASVVATARIRVETLHRRIDALLGPNGEKVDIFGDHRRVSLEMLARLRIKEEVTAGTVDLLHLIDKVLKREREWQDANVEISDIRAGVPYVVAHKSRKLAGPLQASLAGLRISKIRIRIGASEHLVPAMPALKIELGVAGHVNVKLGGLTLATAKVRDGRFRCEAGLRLDSAGELVGESWVEPDRLDLDIHWATLVTAGILTFGLGGLAGLAAVEGIEEYFQDTIPDGINRFVLDALAEAGEVVDVFLGGHFTLRAVRLDGDDVLIDYLAPVEPDPRPTEGYRAIIGRSFEQLGPGDFRFQPRTLGDTWANANLMRIDHIVVVMMENRSYDHVLGYRPLAELDQSDGLTREMIDFLAQQTFSPPQPGEDPFELDQERLDRLQGAAFTIRRFEETAIPRNGRDLKTQFPRKPPIFRRFVEQQLSKRLRLPSGRTVNSPNGFLGAFIGRIGADDKIKVEDVLGYYEADDLEFYSFLADNYAFCDRYHCSHAGPTLPNRMFALTGDVQRDRAGQPILDNNQGANIRLSRAMTIFDLLTRMGIGWRVYESFPSVTMLRLFARYATDDVNIADLSRFYEDAAAGTLPAVSVVEPAMHHHPPNDDHPVADMYDGQRFLRSVYQALRSNSKRWEKTLLIVTYDEHGGFYDHAVPPMAEVRTRPMVLSHQEARRASTPPAAVLEQLAALAAADLADESESPPPASLFTPYGLRVPTFVVSPWVAPGKGPSIVLDHCSILKTILARFCGDRRPFLSDRANASRSFERYLSEPRPRLRIPDPRVLPPLDSQLARTARRIEAGPLFRRQLRSGDVDAHDLMATIAILVGRPHV